MSRRFRRCLTGWSLAAAAVVLVLVLWWARSADPVMRDAADLPNTPAAAIAVARAPSTQAPSPGQGDVRRASPAERAAPRLLPWHRLGTDLPVASLAVQAVRSDNLDDRAAVVHWLSWCSAVNTSSAEPTDRQRAMAEWAAGDGVDVDRLLDEARAARLRLRPLCDAGALAVLVDSGVLREPVGSAAASPSRALMIGEALRNPERYAQAAQQVLARPQAYPLGLDLWLQQQLRHNLPAGVDWSPAQRRHVHAQLLDRLAGPADPRGLRALAQCATAYDCPASRMLGREARAQADHAADQLEALIRQQRWDELHTR
jgi:hypothetical protein